MKKETNGQMTPEEKEFFSKFLADPDLQYLKDWSKNLNSFNLKHMVEMDHSLMIAWLLNPREPHGMGDLGIKYLIRAAYSQHINFKLDNEFFKDHNSTLIGYESTSFSEVLVLTELSFASGTSGRIDLLIIDQVNKVAIIVENKFGASSSKDQHKRYEEWADKELAHYKKLFIHLDFYTEVNKNETNKNNRWIILDYEWLQTFMEYSKARQKDERSAVLINDYYTFLKGDDLFLDDYYKEINDVCIRLKDSHKFIIEKIEMTKPWTKTYSKDLSTLLSSAPGHWEYQIAEFELKYPAAFNLLSEYGKFSALEKVLKGKNFNTELYSTHMHAYYPAWDRFRNDANSFWVLYFALQEQKLDGNVKGENENKFELVLVLYPANANNAGKYALEKLQGFYKKRFSSNQKTLKIKIASDLKLDAEIISKKMIMLRDEIEKVIG